MGLRVLVVLAVIAFVRAKLIDLTCRDIQIFVDAHNEHRLQVAKGLVYGQPGAVRMPYMIWDKELAAKAGKWASRNVFSHNPVRTVGSERFITGENLYLYSTTDSKFKMTGKQAVDSWFMEHSVYNYQPLSYNNLQTVGHYTQVVWANTTHVGCAISHFTDKKYPHNYLVVCNYGPAGNYITQYPYKEGGHSFALVCGRFDTCNRKYGDNCEDVGATRRYLNIFKK